MTHESDLLKDLESKIYKYLRDKTADVMVEDSTNEDETRPMFTVRVAVGTDQRICLQFRGPQEWLEDVRPRASVIEAIGQKITDAKRATQQKESATTPSSSKVRGGNPRRK